MKAEASSDSPSENEDDDLVFHPSFFEASSPSTAHDMVRRVPGFRIDAGEALRGFGVAVGNVLINGTRPVAKSESIVEVLGRIPAARVARIELIRGSARGIDMGAMP